MEGMELGCEAPHYDASEEPEYGITRPPVLQSCRSGLDTLIHAVVSSKESWSLNEQEGEKILRSEWPAVFAFLARVLSRRRHELPLLRWPGLSPLHPKRNQRQ